MNEKMSKQVGLLTVPTAVQCTVEAQDVLTDIFMNGDRHDKITITVDAGRNVQINYEDMDEEWFKELVEALSKPYVVPANELEVEEIDFDNAEQVDQLKAKKVEMPVGVLAILLRYYYTGGGEPDNNNARLAEVMELSLKN